MWHPTCALPAPTMCTEDSAGKHACGRELWGGGSCVLSCDTIWSVCSNDTRAAPFCQLYFYMDLLLIKPFKDVMKKQFSKWYAAKFKEQVDRDVEIEQIKIDLKWALLSHWPLAGSCLLLTILKVIRTLWPMASRKQTFLHVLYNCMIFETFWNFN